MFRRFASLFSTARNKSGRGTVSQKQSFRPQFEALEDRCLLSRYFVAPLGNDNNAGTESKPFATIQHGLDVAANPGDAVLVRGGTYHEHLNFSHSGSAKGGSITLEAYNGEHPILNGTGVPSSDIGFGNNMVQLVNVSYVKLIGFEIAFDSGVSVQDDAFGVRVQGSGSNVEIRNNVIHDITGSVPLGVGGAGIHVYGSSLHSPYANVFIDGNEIYKCQPGDSQTEALAVNGNVTNFQITNNLIHDDNNIGIDMIGGEAAVFGLPDGTQNLPVARNGLCSHNTVYHVHANYGGGFAAGIYVDGGKNIVIEQNTSYQNDQGIEVGAENHGFVASDVIVRNNRVYQNDKGGLVFGGYDATRGRVDDCSFINNTVYQNDTLKGAYGQLSISFGSGNIVTSNIFWASADDVLLNFEGGSSKNTLDHNLWYASDGAAKAQFIWNGDSINGFAAYRKLTHLDAHSVFANPQFANAAARNFHLTAGSPAVDVGSSAAGQYAPTDYDGVVRPQGFAPDAGAFEAPSALIRADGAHRLYAASAPNSVQNPAFSPDGKTLLFTIFHSGYNGGDAGIYTLPVNGNGPPRKLIDEVGQDAVNTDGSSWNAATNRIVFASDRVNTQEIWTMAPDGSQLFQVTSHTTPNAFQEPTFSPDGKWIVFEVFDNTASESAKHGSIWKVAADGTGLTQLTNGPAIGFDDRQSSWSPTGERILFMRRHAGQDDWDLYTMKPDGTDIHRVTLDASGNTDASWSPDGKWLVYSSPYGNLPHAAIFVVSAAGGTPIRITFDKSHEDGAPGWSPDGKWIAFESHVTAGENSRSALWEIAVPALSGNSSQTTGHAFARVNPVGYTPGAAKHATLLAAAAQPEAIFRVLDAQGQTAYAAPISTDLESWSGNHRHVCLLDFSAIDVAGGRSDAGVYPTFVETASYTEAVIGTGLVDRLTGNALNNVLSGGAGNDILSGGDGADILIGGGGADTLIGGNGQDLLLEAAYAQQANIAALNALMAEWGRTDLAYSGRINHLTGAVTGGHNGTFLLTTMGGTPTVTEDGAIDTLTGGSTALDWFFKHTGTNADAITDLNTGGTETVTSI